MIATGLLACLAAALLSSEEPLGTIALGWTFKRTDSDSKPARLPGGGRPALSRSQFARRRPMQDGYKLYRVSATLALTARRRHPVSRVNCGVSARWGADCSCFRQAGPLPASKRRTSRPNRCHRAQRWNLTLREPQWPRCPSMIRFAISQTSPELASAGAPAGRPASAGSGPCRGIVTPRRLTFPFVSIWRTSAKPGALIGCRLNGPGGSTNVQTSALLSR